ncbi:hypothetical protein HPB50_018714 [Hyalomma asiaticum]|uniref:Uncharacterized protein n=1 Tax=Hyalomma asiaticum TaxID=266040 RepID=A0ACB7S0Z0_HYAAI|nr:hypothetical protein HPB50_018714 [Hyalomma asiaticum]
MPPASSILGHIELLSSGFHRKKCLEWVKEYGPVIREQIEIYKAAKSEEDPKDFILGYLKKIAKCRGMPQPLFTGRRDCPGQTFATMEIFLLITFLLQRYHIVPEHPIELDLGSPETELPQAINVKLHFIPRKSTE